MCNSRISVNFQLSNNKLPDVLCYINIHDFKLLMNNSIESNWIPSKLYLEIKANFFGQETKIVKHINHPIGLNGVFTTSDRKVAVATEEVKLKVTLQTAGTAAGHLTPLYQAWNKTTGLFHLHPLILTLTCV